MPARLLSGRGIADARRRALAGRIEALRARGSVPRLAVLLPSSGGASAAYLRAKERLGGRIGVDVRSILVNPPTTEALLAQIAALAEDRSVSGILIESPLPAPVDARAVYDAIPTEKDVDGASTASLGRLTAGAPGFVPATAAAVLALLDGHGIDPAGRHAVVIGRSLVVGRPLSLLLLQRDATVTVCHSRTADLAGETRRADLVCVAVGRPGLVTGEMVRPGAIVVDVGTNVVDGRLVGDVDAESVSPVAGALTPVPGGVGPLTTTVLMEHVAAAAEAAADRSG